MYGIVDFIFSIFRRYTQDDQTNVSYVAHIFGALSGLLVGIVVLKNRKVEHWERKLKIACVITFVSILLVFILFNVTASVWKDEFFHKQDPALENCQLRLWVKYNQSYHNPTLGRGNTKCADSISVFLRIFHSIIQKFAW